MDAGHGDLAATRRAEPTPGPQAAVARDALVNALEASDDVLAAWEGGSAAFGRADETSDVDVVVICKDGTAAAVIDLMGAALQAVEPDLHVWDHPTSPFGPQRFWQPVDATGSSICMVDTLVVQHDGDRARISEFLTPERHGRALPLIDRIGALTEPTPFDVADHRAKLVAELDRIRSRHGVLRSFGQKELARGRTIDAHWIHNAMVVAPLVTLLGMVHRPLRFDFALRYLHDELPGDVVERLAPLVEPGVAGLGAAIAAGVSWIESLLASIVPDELTVEQHARDMRAAFAD